MYTPSAFAETRPAILHVLMRHHPLATLISQGDSGLDVTHLPLLYRPDTHTLIGHVARANPHGVALTTGARVLAVFHGPQHYISPNWYAAKQEHGRVVPTWNYVAVHVHGRVTLHRDSAWLREAVRLLTDEHEQAQTHPWSIDDAPASYIDGLTNAITGLEIQIERLEGKWKLGQNRSREDRAGVAVGLHALATPAATEMAQLIEESLASELR